MGKSCCENKSEELTKLRGRQSKTLLVVLAINAVMFFVEFGAGLVGKSTSFLGDSLDMWPDIAVGGVIAVLFLSSAVTVLREALPEVRTGAGV